MRKPHTLLIVLVVVVAGVGAPVGAEPTTQEMVTITVEVVDRGGSPLARATVNASWDGGQSSETTKSNGKALVDVPEGERVELNVTHAHYTRNFPYVIDSATADEEYTVEVAQKGSATIRTTNVAGEPVDATVRVSADGREVASGDSGNDGTFRTGTIERREYAVTVVRPEYFRNETTLRVTGQVEQTVRIERGSVAVEFAVTDDHFDPPRPVENATVSVDGVGSVQTLGNGEATIQLPANTQVTATVTKPGYEEATERFRVGERQKTIDATIQRTPTVRLVTANTRVVVGESVRIEVTNEYGTPLEGTTVTLDGETVGQTDENGVLQVPVETPGTHELRARTDSRESDTVVVEGVRPGGPTPTATPTEGIGLPGFTPATAVFALLALLGAALFLRRRR